MAERSEASKSAQRRVGAKPELWVQQPPKFERQKTNLPCLCLAFALSLALTRPTFILQHNRTFHVPLLPSRLISTYSLVGRSPTCLDFTKTAVCNSHQRPQAPPFLRLRVWLWVRTITGESRGWKHNLTTLRPLCLPA